MTKRIIVAASLLATVCAAQADVLPAQATSSQANFLDQWTDANGNDIASSNVLGNGVRLVGGVALGNESAAQALLQKASQDAATNNAAVTIKRTDGITGTYAVVKANYKAAAAAGDAVSVVTNSQGDLVITKGRTGGGASGGGGGGGGGAASGGPSGSVSDVPKSNPALPAGNPGTAEGPLADVPAGNGNGNSAGGAAQVGEVPEPSTIALMLAGMMGAMSIARRRSR